MRNRKFIEWVSILSILASLFVIGVATSHLPPSTDRALHKAIGIVLAKQALSLRGAEGQMIIITRDTETFPQPALEILLRSFQDELRRARVQIDQVQRLQVDPLRRAEVPPGDFFELIRKSPNGQVIVSLLGPPLLSEEQRDRLGPIKSKIVAFCSSDLLSAAGLGKLFDAGLLHAAVVSRPSSPSPVADQSSAFDQLYLIVTDRDHAELLSKVTTNL